MNQIKNTVFDEARNLQEGDAYKTEMNNVPGHGLLHVGKPQGELQEVVEIIDEVDPDVGLTAKQKIGKAVMQYFAGFRHIGGTGITKAVKYIETSQNPEVVSRLYAQVGRDVFNIILKKTAATLNNEARKS